MFAKFYLPLVRLGAGAGGAEMLVLFSENAAATLLATWLTGADPRVVWFWFVFDAAAALLLLDTENEWNFIDSYLILQGASKLLSWK